MKEKKGARRDQGTESAGAKPRGRQGGDSKADKGRVAERVVLVARGAD